MRGSGRIEAVMSAVRETIRLRSFADGGRLPSVRHFAATMGVAPSTVVEAYARLEAEGVIRARRGSGFFVVDASTPVMPLAQAETPSQRAVDPFWVSRHALDAETATLKPGCGWLPADWLPEAALRKALRGLGRADNAVLTEYGGTRGAWGLRRLLQARFAEEGLHVPAGQVLLTGSGTQAIDLVCRLLLRPGDCVVVDDPCYFNFRALLRAHQARVVGVPFTATGPDVAAFERVVATERPRLYVTNSALHNPTGASVSPQTAHRVLSVARTHGVVVIEDDIFAEFEPSPSPRLALLDGLETVIRVGSFSKTLSAAVRCGYIAARPSWIEPLIDLQIATCFGGPSPVAAAAIAAVLSAGGYRRHMDMVRARLARLRVEMAERLDDLGLRPWILPRGGFYLWCRMPGGDAVDLAQRAMRHGVVLAPGAVFSVSGAATDFLRFNVAQMRDPRVFDILRGTMGEVAV